MKSTWRKIAGAAAGAVVFAFVLSGAAEAVTSNAFRYAEAKVGWFGIPPQAFAPSSMVTTNNNYSISSAGIFAGANSCFNTSLNLPHGSKMKNLTVQYASNSNDGVTASIVRIHVTNGTSANIGSLTSDDVSGTRQVMAVSITDAFSTVNNRDYVYGLTVCLTNSGEIYYAGRIAYTYLSAGD